MSVAAKLLDRLDRVRQTGPGRWLARCPAHQDRGPSLSIRELDDRVLLHDFGGCEPGDVLAAVGLQMSDLFEKPLSHQSAASHCGVPARDRLMIIDHEVVVATLIIADVVKDKGADEAQLKRLAEAAGRIGRARDHGRA